MRSALAKLPGVDADDVDVDYAAKTATIHFKGADAPSADALLAAFEGTRFKATLHP